MQVIVGWEAIYLLFVAETLVKNCDWKVAWCCLALTAIQLSQLLTTMEILPISWAIHQSLDAYFPLCPVVISKIWYLELVCVRARLRHCRKHPLNINLSIFLSSFARHTSTSWATARSLCLRHWFPMRRFVRAWTDGRIEWKDGWIPSFAAWADAWMEGWSFSRLDVWTSSQSHNGFFVSCHYVASCVFSCISSRVRQYFTCRTVSCLTTCNIPPISMYVSCFLVARDRD